MEQFLMFFNSSFLDFYIIICNLNRCLFLYGKLFVDNF